MMNKKILVTGLFVIAIALLVSSVSAQTVLNMNWDGVGVVDVTFDADDDASMGFHTEGNYISGNLYAKDSENNPYGYGVSDFLTNVDAYVETGGIGYWTNRTDSKESMYGVADQTTYSYIGSSGSASMTFQTQTNFADMKSCNYEYQANNQFVADADGGVYEAYHEVMNGDNSAYFGAFGDGTLNVNHMSDEAGNTGINFGAGCGCYTNADVYQTGAGQFEVFGHFMNSLTNDDVTVNGEVTYTESYNFTDGFTWEGYNFNGN